MTAGIGHVMVLAALLVGLGVTALVSRRRAIGAISGGQLIAAGSALALVGLAREGYQASHPFAGMAFAVLVIVGAAAQSLVAAAVATVVLRRAAADTPPGGGG